MGSTVYVRHTFTPGAAHGRFLQQDHVAGARLACRCLLLDVNCNGTYDGGDTARVSILQRRIAICILVQDTVP